MIDKLCFVSDFEKSGFGRIDGQYYPKKIQQDGG
jgi:hypothetical protein|tara:strand:+ start:1196 stop:1297 length:102 start_codon:yes stop_codon:yes gene_type:complete